MTEDQICQTAARGDLKADPKTRSVRCRGYRSQAMDILLGAGINLGPLQGIPISIKDDVSKRVGSRRSAIPAGVR